MTSSALTRWLRQGLMYGICPLCRAHHKLDREYIWGFFDQWSMRDDVVEQFARARGFCADHARQLCRIEVDAMRTTIGVTDVYLATVERLLADLASLLPAAGALSEERCPACAYREQGIADNVRYLLDELVGDGEFRERLAAGSGLCVPHFRIAWQASQTSEQRQHLAVVEHTAALRLAGELREHARKQRAEAAGEPAGPEADSWQRAIWMSSGWPAPARAASAPEGENPYAPTLAPNTAPRVAAGKAAPARRA
ncbi:MAG TPA: DUF6062 family protein [Solirubrobacteraceae bacterium]|nr:DUF6062 family protein [Solirubrobacteraceae bacterium]